MTLRSLQNLFSEHKGKVSDKWSLYLTEYDRIFTEYRDKPISLLEIGIQNGGSLEIWAKYFVRANNLIGCDINPDCSRLVYEDSRISVVIGDVNLEETLPRILQHSSRFNIIIDDGSHRSSDIVMTFAKYFPYVSDGGLFVVEDLHCSYWQEFEGALFAPFSSIQFFKRLSDIINHEHWGIDKVRADLLSGFSSKYGCSFDDKMLSGIHSIEFVNSMCIIRKASPEINQLGLQYISGTEEPIVSRHEYHLKTIVPFDQSNNVWSKRKAPIEEELMQRIEEVAERDGQIANLSQAVAERDGQIANLSQTVAEREGQIVSLIQAVAERDRQIADLSQAVAERDGQIASLSQTVAEREGQVVSLIQAVAEREERITSLNQDIVERDRIISEHDKQIATLNHAAAERDRLQEELSKQNAEYAVLTSMIHDKNTHITNIEAQLNNIYASNGWRLLLAYYFVRNKLLPVGSRKRTIAKFIFNMLILLPLSRIKKAVQHASKGNVKAILKKIKKKMGRIWTTTQEYSVLRRMTSPLRKAKAALSWLYNLFRCRLHAMKLEPVHDLVQEGPVYHSTGNDPQFFLRSSKHHLPKGWCLVSYETDSDIATLSVELYVDSGCGFSEDAKISLPAVSHSFSRHLIRLPDYVIALRLDPMKCAGKFTLNKIFFYEIGKLQALLIILWPHVQPAILDPRRMYRLFQKALTVLSSEGTSALKQKLLSLNEQDSYDPHWIASYETLTEDAHAAILDDLSRLPYKPLISVVMPTYNTDKTWLNLAIESVRSQLYPRWELCIADDASNMPHVRNILAKYETKDSRIKVAFRKSNGHISQATNSALELATGEFVTLMDHDDEIAPNALYEFVKVLNQDPDLDMLYSDEDKITTENRRYEPFFKPDWSPDYLESCMYTAHLALYRKTVIDRIGGFRSECNGAQDYDFVLRFTEHTDKIKHVDKILYHWRAIPGSTAASMDQKTYVVASGIRALEDRLKRTGRTGTVTMNRYAGCFDIFVDIPNKPFVSIIIPTAGKTITLDDRKIDLVSNCVRSIKNKSTYSNYELVIVDNGDLAGSTYQFLNEAGCRFITYQEPIFNISKKINRGATAAAGKHLIFLNDDIEIITTQWIERLLEQALKPGVGVVGAKLLYPNKTLQHVGVAHTNGLPDHVRKHFMRDDPGYFFSTVSVRNYLGVTGACMLTSASIFESVGGFSEEFEVNYSDIDYCMKLREMGLRTVYTPHAELYHYESMCRTATVSTKEIQLYLQKWSSVTRNDPYYNETYLNASPLDFSLRSIKRTA